MIHNNWSKWTIDPRRGELVTPAGETILRGQIVSQPYRLHELSTVKRELKILQDNTSMDKFRYQEIDELKRQKTELEEHNRKLKSRIAELEKRSAKYADHKVLPFQRSLGK